MAGMMKSAAYSYIEGAAEPYALNVLCVEDGVITQSISGKFATLEEFYQKIREVVPILEGSEPPKGQELL